MRATIVAVNVDATGARSRAPRRLAVGEGGLASRVDAGAVRVVAFVRNATTAGVPPTPSIGTGEAS